jgi:hypothetical protein
MTKGCRTDKRISQEDRGLIQMVKKYNVSDFYKRGPFNFLVVLFLLLIMVLLCPPQHIYAQEFSINGGLGSVQMETRSDHFSNSVKAARRHIGIGFDLEKKGSPLKISFQGILFNTSKKTERWCSPDSQDEFQEDALEINGIQMDALSSFLLHTYATKTGSIVFKPYIGGGLVYRRFQFKRGDIEGPMIPIPLSSTDKVYCYIGNECFLAIGGMPKIGALFSFPKLGFDVRVDAGWAFLSTKSTIDYHLSLSGDKEAIYPLVSYSSGNSLLWGIQFSKRWESFALGIGYEWEKITIDDKSATCQTVTGTTVSLPFPELTLKQGSGYLTLSYIF